MKNFSMIEVLAVALLTITILYYGLGKTWQFFGFLTIVNMELIIIKHAMIK